MTELPPLGRLVRRHDPDRFFTALFAPAARREALFVLYATNHELARAREVTSNPMMALIRLQWWREVAEGARRRHEVAGPLGDAFDAGLLHAPDILGMIEGREAEAEPIETVDAFRAYLLAAHGGVAVAAGRALGATAAECAALRCLGAAYGAGGVLRSVPSLARQGRTVLPLDRLHAAGLGEPDVVARPGDPRLQPVLQTIREMGQAWLSEGGARRLPRATLAAALPAVFARRDLGRLGPLGGRGLVDKLGVLRAAALGRF